MLLSGGDTTGFETGFRKCNNTPKPSMKLAEYYNTPGSLIVNLINLI